MQIIAPRSRSTSARVNVRDIPSPCKILRDVSASDVEFVPFSLEAGLEGCGDLPIFSL